MKLVADFERTNSNFLKKIPLWVIYSQRAAQATEKYVSKFTHTANLIDILI